MSVSFFYTWETKTVLMVWSLKCQIEEKKLFPSHPGYIFTATIWHVLHGPTADFQSASC